MKGGPQTLLAKSVRRGEKTPAEATLRGHTAMVVKMARVLLDARGVASLRAVGLPDELAPRLSRIVLLAAFAHDLGKASDHFQAMVRGERDVPQLVRHEALSLWLTWPGQALAGFLRPAVEQDVDYLMAVIAAAGHHRKFCAKALADDGSGAGSRITVLCAHPEFAQVLGAGRSWLGLATEPPVLRNLVADVDDVRRSFDRWDDAADDALRDSVELSRLLAVAKALVLDADVAGSALPPAGELPKWVETALSNRLDTNEARGIAERRLGGRPPREFQNAVAASRAMVTLATAGCGTGKTVAAYMWYAAQHAGRQLWVTYPTTGTATEGFRDYVADAGIDARLEHGRVEADLRLLSLPDEDGDGREVDRLASLRNWGAQVVTCTVDTVLGIVQNLRKGHYAWVGLADGAVVFDEVHAYDDELFGALLRFLAEVPGVPALLMTASLPTDRLDALREVVRSAHGAPMAEVSGPVELEELPRYRLVADAQPWNLVRETLAEAGKVLWVSNTVGRCIEVVKHADALGIENSIYHSRYRYMDRVERHRDVIRAFGNAGPAFAVTTQVAEMSLDLSADLLVTDLAPVPALIQRLGRLNRRSTPENPRSPMPCVILPLPGDRFASAPYTDAELSSAARWLAALGHGPLSQADLARAWLSEDAPRRPVVPGTSTWFDGVFRTEPGTLRAASPGLTVLLRRDLADVRSGRRLAVEVALPMSPPSGAWKNAWSRWEMEEFYRVAPDDALHYDERVGGSWRS